MKIYTNKSLDYEFFNFSKPMVRTYNAKNVNKVFVIGSQSFARGASSQSYNEFVDSHSGVNFIIPRETLVLCRDSFFAKCMRCFRQYQQENVS